MAAANFLRTLVDVDDMSVGEAKRRGRALFGDALNLYKTAGLWHLGKFHDSGWTIDPINGGRIEVPPWQRDEEIFAVAPTLRELFRFTFGRTVYSGAGMAPGASNRSGYRPVFDKLGRLRGYTSPAGLFTKRFPAPTEATS
jgi:hypothetical protein